MFLRYIPIIPTVLVNGSEGIGTGWSSYIPNYSPRDIIANVKRLLNGEQMQPMHPWYRGFKGTIEKTALKESGATYTITGIIEEVNETTVRIKELPIRRWTQDYREFLESLSDAADSFIEVFIIITKRYLSPFSTFISLTVMLFSRVSGSTVMTRQLILKFLCQRRT